MPTERFSLRWDTERKQKTEADAKAKHISVNQWILQAIDEKNKGKPRPQEVPTLKMILTKYPAKCSKADCKADIPIGSPALWAKGVIICMDCYIKTLGDKALTSKYLKMRELSKILKGLKKQADIYADLILDTKHQIKFGELSQKIDRVLRLTDDYLRNVGTPEEKQLLDELRQFFKQVLKDWEDFEALMRAKVPAFFKKRVKPRSHEI